jgi:uncharacterized protein YbcC (UPF0753/DUF2309 family)
MRRTALLDEADPIDQKHPGVSAAGSREAESTETLTETLEGVRRLIPPLWPLRDYVAVNPFLGFAGRRFLSARQSLREVRDCELLPGIDHYRADFRSGEFGQNDIEAAVRLGREEYPELCEAVDVAAVIRLLEGDQSQSPSQRQDRRWFTLAEAVDRKRSGAWASHIVNDITRHLSAHYDEGQAAWPSPWKGLPLFQAWREGAKLSRRMDALGIAGFRSLVAQLPAEASDAIREMLNELGIPKGHWRGFLLSQAFSVGGWASLVRYRLWEAEMSGGEDPDLIGLIAIRLAYDVALARAKANEAGMDVASWAARSLAFEGDGEAEVRPSHEATVRYVLQLAAEHAHRRQVLRQLITHRPESADRQAETRKGVQMIFCIDVRSEVMRRHLESLSDSIETFGFAGFFGMALRYVPLGESQGQAQCPVLLSPGFRLQETVCGGHGPSEGEVLSARIEQRTGRKVWKAFQGSAVSTFSFVESLGLCYLGKLLTDCFRWTRPVAKWDRDGLPQGADIELGPKLHDAGTGAIPSAKQVDLAEGMLRNLGLTHGFARVVAICGHASEVVNNPYRAGLDCGACGGHSGEPNARFAAALLNDPQVRKGLAGRGIRVPDDTHFIAGLHNTTTDEIGLLDTAAIPATHADDIAALRGWIGEAGRLCRAERGRRLGGESAEGLLRRCRDWSEVRPEWGLAGNAAFIVAPRSRTAGLDLGGRAFMHSYDQAGDPDGKVLELIMTAPMVVTSWINLQYYASAVDNRAYGSGNKVIHNVVGQFGVLEGNGGDLMTGLPWQSVHDGTRFQHQPLRLMVLIEATCEAIGKVIANHPSVRDLVTNGWISLVALDGDRYYRWTAGETWLPIALDAGAF